MIDQDHHQIGRNDGTFDWDQNQLKEEKKQNLEIKKV